MVIVELRGIRKFHQIITKPDKCNGIFIREYACLCNVCIKGRVESCQAAESNQYFRHNIDVLKAKWYQFHQNDSDKGNDNEELDEIDMFIESDVIKYIVKGDIAIQVNFSFHAHCCKLFFIELLKIH